MKRLVGGMTLVGVVLASWTASAQGGDERKMLSLMQAVERALAGNADLRRERVAVAATVARQMAAAGQFDVLLESGLGIRREVAPSLCPANDPACNDPYAGRTTTSSLTVGFSRRLETGGTLKLGGALTRTDVQMPNLYGTTAGYGTTIGSFYDSNLALTFTHPLLRGLGTEVTLANLRKARIQHDIAQLNRQMRVCNVVRDVVVAYWELAYTTQDLAIKQTAVALAQEQLRTTQALITAGRLADSDAASVQRAIAQRQEDLALAEQNLYFRSLDLQRLFGVPVNADLPLLAAADAPSSPTPNVEPVAEIARALEANPQLRALNLGMALSQTDVATARNTLRPRLDFAGGIGPVGRKVGLAGTAREMTELSNLGWSAGLVFELPLENRVARGQMHEAQEELNLSRINAEDFAAQVRELVLRASRSIVTAAKRVELGRHEVVFAGQNLDAERARFQVGRTTNNDVLLRQQELKDAETRLLRSTVDQNESEVALSAVTAEVLDHFALVLKGL